MKSLVSITLGELCLHSTGLISTKIVCYTAGYIFALRRPLLRYLVTNEVGVAKTGKDLSIFDASKLNKRPPQKLAQKLRDAFEEATAFMNDII